MLALLIALDSSIASKSLAKVIKSTSSSSISPRNSSMFNPNSLSTISTIADFLTVPDLSALPPNAINAFAKIVY
jgi:hypothetical protein